MLLGPPAPAVAAAQQPETGAGNKGWKKQQLAPERRHETPAHWLPLRATGKPRRWEAGRYGRRKARAGSEGQKSERRAHTHTGNRWNIIQLSLSGGDHGRRAGEASRKRQKGRYGA